MDITTNIPEPVEPTITLTVSPDELKMILVGVGHIPCISATDHGLPDPFPIYAQMLETVRSIKPGFNVFEVSRRVFAPQS